jgi:hypothetical protein
MKRVHILGALVTAAALCGGCAVGGSAVTDTAAAAAPATPAGTAPLAPAATEPADTSAGLLVEHLGVRVQGVRLNASGYVVDVRYRVLDPEKAKPLLDRKVRPVLVDESTGNRYYVPAPPIVGSLRQTSRNKVVHTDRNYFILFANPDKQLQVGSRVSLYVGHQKLDGLRVEAN